MSSTQLALAGGVCLMAGEEKTHRAVEIATEQTQDIYELAVKIMVAEGSRELTENHIMAASLIRIEGGHSMASGTMTGVLESLGIYHHVTTYLRENMSMIRGEAGEVSLDKSQGNKPVSAKDVEISEGLKEILDIAQEQTKYDNAYADRNGTPGIQSSHFIGPEHILLAMVEASSNLGRLISGHLSKGITGSRSKVKERVMEAVQKERGDHKKGTNSARAHEYYTGRAVAYKSFSQRDGKLAQFDSILKNISERVREKIKETPEAALRDGEMVIREEFLEVVLRHLTSRGKKNSVHITRDLGAGGKSFLESLVQAVERYKAGEWTPQKESVRQMLDKFTEVEFLELNPNSIMAGTKYRGELEARLEQMTKTLKEAGGKYKLIVRDLGIFLKTGGDKENPGIADKLMRMLEDAQRDPESGIQMIALSNKTQARKLTDNPFVNTMERVELKAPTAKELTGIAKIKLNEALRDMSIDSIQNREEFLEIVVDVAESYPSVGPGLLGKLELMFETVVMLNDRMIESGAKESVVEITRHDVERAASERKLGGARVGNYRSLAFRRFLKNVKDNLAKNVFGIDTIVEKFATLFVGGMMGAREAGQTRGNILFVGPSGNGKTETARQTMSTESMAKELADNLDVGFTKIEGQQLTRERLEGSRDSKIDLVSEVHEKPFRIVFIDEVNLGTREALELLETIFDKGRLENHDGSKVASFENTFFIMAINHESAIEVMRTYGYTEGTFKKSEPIKELTQEELTERMANPHFPEGLVQLSPRGQIEMTKALETTLRPAFLGRTEQILTGFVGAKTLGRIVEGFVSKRNYQFEKDSNSIVTLTDAGREAIVNEAMNPGNRSQGARIPRKRIDELLAREQERFLENDANYNDDGQMITHWELRIDGNEDGYFVTPIRRKIEDIVSE